MLFDVFGAGNDASAAGTGGMFALEQHLTYRREVLVGDEVAVHLRLVDRSEKLIHLVSYLVNHSRARWPRAWRRWRPTSPTRPAG